jgi:hypothetical protein
MSIDLMKRAWRVDLPQGSDKLVLVALADFANTSGEAWPSNATLADMCSRGETAIRDALHRLVSQGHVTRRPRSGQTAMFIVHPLLTPPHIRGGSEIDRGSEIDTPTPPHIRGGPLPISEGDPSLFPNPNPQEPPMNPQEEPPKKRAREIATEIPDWIPRDAWDGFIEMRRKIKAPPTEHAIKLLIGQLDEHRANGHDPATLLNKSTTNNWKGIFLPRENEHDQSRRYANGSANDGSSANPIVRALLAGRGSADT